MANRSGVSSQNISRTDVLAEGPVRGLKNGSSSIFFNDVASEDASVRGYNPVEGTASGKITFDGTSLTNTGITGANLPTTLVNPTGVPRQLVLKDYRTADVTVVDASTEGAAHSVVTCTAASGTPFTTDWSTQSDYKTTAYLKGEGVLIKGQFLYTNSTTGSFTFAGLSDAVDFTKTYELRISVGFYIDTINSASSLTLKSSYSGYSGATPAAGTYFFEIPPLVSGRRNFENNRGVANKIEGIEVEFRPGHRYQDPLNEIGGVGGSVAATTSVNHELKVIGTGQISGVSPVPEDGTIGSTMESGLPLDSQDDVANDATVLNDTAFGITAAQRPEVDEISLRITYPGGLQYINSEKGKRSTSYARYLIQIQTTLDNVDSEWENAFPAAGPYVGHQGRTNAAYSFDHVIGLNQYRPFDSFKVRVIRLTRHIGLRVESSGHGNGVTNREKWTLIAKSKIDQLGYVIKDRLSYPYTSVISTSFSSKQYQEPPKMSYLMQGLLVKVPSTYTPREYSTQTDSDGNPVAVYEEFWDGTFKNELQYTDNPAWVFYDIVTNNRYGAGRWIKESDIDKYALYRIAKYCDELVDNGAGGIEPRFRSNIFLTKATDVYKVLKDFASAFTGMLYWMDGHLTAVQDSPSDPVYNFTKGNVIDGKFGYESTGTKTRSNQIIVTWNDPKSNYEPVPLIVEDREAIVRDKRIITEEVVAFGCTSEAQAVRYGRWKLWTAQKQTEVVSFKSALNSIYIKPGDIINVQDADREGVQYSGRVSSATSSSLTLDRSVTLNSGSTYTLSTLVTEPAAFYAGADDVTINGTTYSRGDRLPEAYVYDTANDDGTYDLEDLDTEAKASNAFDDTSGTNLLPVVWKNYSYIQENTVTNSAGSTSLLTVSSFESTPSTSTIWALKEVKDNLTVVGSSKKYRVLSINQDKSNEYGFSAVEYYDEKYAYVDSGYITAELQTTIYEESEPRDGETEMSSPSNLRLILETDAAQPGEEFKLEWDPSTSDFVDLYEVHHNIEDLDTPIRTAGTFARFTNIADGSMKFDVRAVSTGGNYSPFTSLSYESTDIYGENVPRMPEGIPKGVISTAQGKINSSNQFVFQATNTSVASITNPFVTYTITGAKNVANISTGIDYYLYLDTATPSLKLLEYNKSALSNLHYYRDVGSGNSALSTAWTSIGTVSVSANSNEVTGTGFNTNIKLRDVLNLENSTSPSDGDGAVVVGIISDTKLVIDRTFDTAKTSITGYRSAFRPDYANDAIFAEITKTGNTISTNNFITLRSQADDVEGTTETLDDGTIAVKDGGISVDKIAANSINADKIQANSITTDQLAANSITTDQLAANSITTDQLAANSITTDQLAANSITADQITANSVVSSLITASTIQSSHIKSNSIVSTIIDATSITASDITTTSLSALSANLGDITAGTMKGGSIPDANSAPASGESGAFLDLTGGKMVFGDNNKYILFDGTDLELNGVTIDASSTINATAAADITVKEDGTSVGTGIASFNFTTGLDLSVSGTEVTVSAADQTPSWVPSTNPNYQVQLSEGAFVDGDKTKLDDIEANADVTDTANVVGALTAGTNITIAADGTISSSNQTLTTEEVQDIVGGMVSGNTESGITVTYDDAGNSLDFSVASQTQNNFTNTLKNKLDNIEENATADQTASEIRTLVGSATDSNVLTDALKNKLDGIEDSATADQTAAEIRVLVGSATDSNVLTDALKNKLDGIETNATADQTAAEIRTLVGAATDSNVFTDTEQSKLAGIAANANNFTLSAATSTALGGIQIGYSENGKNYPVELSSNKAFVNVPWANTEYSQATSSALGLVKIGYSENGKNYPVELSSGQMFVNVPWTDNNTIYTAGTGLSLSAGNEFSVNNTVVRTTGAQTIGGNKTFSNNVTVTGDLTVNGTTTSINTTNLTIDDNVVVVNAAQTGTPASSVTAGLEVERGDATNVRLVYAETGVGPNSNLAGWDFGNTNVTADTFYGDFIGDIIGSPSSFGTLTTDNLTEGTNNLYFTNSRARSAISQASGGGISYNSGNGQISVDSTVIRTTGNQSMSGRKTFSGGIALNTANSIFFENNQHLISYNDGRGNFNIRVGTDDDEVVTEAGYVFHTEWSQSSGFYALYVSPASQSVGDQQGTDFSWREQFKIDKDKVYLRYQGSNILNTNNTGINVEGDITVSGTVDGRDLATDGSKLDGIATNANNFSLPTNNVTNASVSGSTLTLSRQGAADVTFTDTNTEYTVGDGGLTQKNFTSTLKNKLDGIANNATNTSQPAITSSGSLIGQTAAQIRSAIGAGTSNLQIGTTASTALAGNTTIPTNNNQLTNGAGYITNSTASLNANKITAGTINNARLSTDMQLTANAPRYRLEESGVTNTPNWWMIADGGNYSIRLNNTGVYPLTIQTNSANNAVTSVNIGYNMSVSGNITVTGTVDGRDVATDGTKLDTIDTNADVTPSWVPSTNPNYLTSISSSNVTNALGFTPYNATNPNGYISSFDITTQTDPKYLRSNAADTATGKLTFNGGLEVLSGTGGGALRIKRNSSSATGDDVTDIHMDDNSLFFDIDNENDNDGGVFYFRKKSGGNFAAPIAYLGTNQRIFADNYHPNADKWTTARTLSLTGDVTGSVSWDGSGNASITTAVGNDSHLHGHFSSEGLNNTDSLDTLTSNGYYHWGSSLPTNAPNGYMCLIVHVDGGQPTQMAFGGTSPNNEVYIRRRTSGNWSAWNRMFSDEYHPNADTLTTARNIGVTLSGDVTGTGSASFNGSGAIDIAVSTTGGGGTDLTALTDMTQTILETDEFVVLDNNAPRRKAASEVISDLNIVTGNVTGTLFADVIVANSIETDMLKANTITADKIAANLISAEKIAAGSITAEQLQISNNTSGSAGIFMDYNGGNSRIDIRDSSALRVRIGYLG